MRSEDIIKAHSPGIDVNRTPPIVYNLL